METVRPPAVAGSFYPGNVKALTDEIARYLSEADAGDIGQRPVKALIVPHAGYVYSGPVAAHAYARIRPASGRIRRVVLFGPAHRVPVRGMAVPSVDAFGAPLGDVRIDRAGCESLLRLDAVELNDRAHAFEHSIEVQIPFLQTVLDDFALLPVVVGDADPQQVADAMDAVWGGDETLIVVSSDLSHYLTYEAAQRVDADSVKAVLNLSGLTRHAQACGAIPVNGLILAARRHGLTPHLLDLRNSGDTAGDRERVVGYAAIAFTGGQEAGNADDDPGRALLVLARNAIHQALGQPATVETPAHPDLARPGATFVTLTQDGQLRGCMGSLDAHRSLEADVRANAVSAALHDPRFAPLTAGELDRTRVEVSMLTASAPMAFLDEADALHKLRPGQDGLIFECHGQRATFLPQVWEQLPRPEDFMAHLKRKAGFAADFWSPEVRLYRYEVQKWKEPPKR